MNKFQSADICASLKLLARSAWPVQEWSSTAKKVAVFIRCRLLGWLSKLMNADFGHLAPAL